MSLEINSDFLRVFKDRDVQLRRIRRLFELANKHNNNSDIVVDVTERQVLRCLTTREIKILKNKQCSCENWSTTVRLLVSKEKQQTDRCSELNRLVSETRFDGLVILDMEDMNNGNNNNKGFKTETDTISNNHHPSRYLDKLPNGIHSNLMVTDSIICVKSSKCYRNSIISNTYIGPFCKVVNCGFITTTPDFSYFNFGKLNISVGPESGGGRKLVLTSEHTMIDICRQLQGGNNNNNKNNQKKDTVKNDTTDFVPMNVLSQGNIICDTPTIQNVYLHEKARVQASSSVSDVTMLPDSLIGNSSTVSNCLLQWDSVITDNSTITDTLLMEQAHCGPSSIVASSVMGPDVHTSAGEIHASVIGPNTNAHHQSLLIGVIWCLGRGNVGYGANVGSNHTGRLPDQETMAGEGIFWGLSCVIKFPVDLSFSPYSVVAAGTTMPPQRVCMPFSLILEQQDGNIIIPGWVLQSSPYTLARSEKKYATRRKAKRHGFYTGWKIQNQSVIEMCRWAKNALKAGRSDGSEIKTPGIGANTLTERARDAGIRAYTEYIQHYALHGLLDWLMGVSGKDHGRITEKQIQSEFLLVNQVMNGKNASFDPGTTVGWPSLPWEMKGADEWAFQKTILQEEFPKAGNLDILSWIEQLLKRLVQLEKDFARRIHKSKSRDDTRGAKTIPGYKDVHISASDDPVIIEADKNAQEVEAAVSNLLQKLPSQRTRSRL